MNDIAYWFAAAVFASIAGVIVWLWIECGRRKRDRRLDRLDEKPK